MDSQIHAAFREFIVGVARDCGLPDPLWENDVKCNDDYLKNCPDELIWVVRYLGPSRAISACKSTEAVGQFQLSLYAKAGCGTEKLYRASDCLICAIEDACRINHHERKNRPVTLILSGLGNTLPTTGQIIPGDPSGRVLLPITVPFRAFYCC